MDLFFGYRTEVDFWQTIWPSPMLLADDGIICVDDVLNPAYAQVSAAVFSFLQAKRFDLTIFACGYNKGYPARPTYARHYMQMIRSSLRAALRERGLNGVYLIQDIPNR
jgi:hypothetical protein